MGPSEQNQYFCGFETKSMFNCLYIHAVVLQRGLQSLEGKNERFVGKKRKKRLANSSQADYRQLEWNIIMWGEVKTITYAKNLKMTLNS